MAENVNSEQDELEPIDAMEGSFLDVSRTEEVETCSQRQNRCFHVIIATNPSAKSTI